MQGIHPHAPQTYSIFSVILAEKFLSANKFAMFTVVGQGGLALLNRFHPAMMATSAFKRLPENPLSGSLHFPILQLLSNPAFCRIQHRADLGSIRSPRLRQIRSAAAFAADLFGCKFDQIAGFHFSSQSFGYAGAQGYFAVVYCCQKNHGVVGFAG